MSTGAFVEAVYESGKPVPNLHPIRVQPETLTLTIDGAANSTAAADPTSELRAFSSSRNRRGAVNARKVGLEITASGDNGYEVGSVVYVPVMTAATLSDYLFPAGKTGTYNGASVRVIGSSPERINS